MKKCAVICFMLVILMLAGCSKNTDAPATTDVKAPAAALPAETQPEATDPEEPEVFVSTTIVQDGICDYVIVHDGSSPAMLTAQAVKNTLSARFGVDVPMVNKSTEEATCEIIIGNSRPIVEKTAKKLRGENDFALRVEENKLILYAVDELSYTYMTEYLTRDVLVKPESGNLVLDSNDNLIFSQNPFEENYIDYCLADTTYIPLDILFAWRQFQNADTTLPYRIYVPFNYDPEKQYPLFLNMHGAGLRGTDNQRQLGFVDDVLNMRDLPMDDCIILMPQCDAANRWVDSDWSAGRYDSKAVKESNELAAVVELIAQLQGQYSIDEKRIYVCGFSMGGYATWDLLTRHPDLFCAGIAMCGGGDPEKADVLKDIPIWAIHGAFDPTVPVRGTQAMIAALDAAGGTKHHYTELPHAEHDVWNYTYSNHEIFAWLFAQSK